jgi:hypothetical protein
VVVFFAVEVILIVEIVVSIVVVVSLLFTALPVYSDGPNIIAIRIKTEKARATEAIIFLMGNN